MKEQFARSYDDVGYVALGDAPMLYTAGKGGTSAASATGNAAYKDIVAAKGDQILTKPFLGKDGTPTFLVATAIKGADGKPTGMVTATVTLSELDEKVKTLRLGDNGYSILLDSDGTYLSSPNADDVLQKSIADAGDPALVTLGNKILSSRADMERYTTADGEDMIAIHYPIAGTSWGIASIAYADELFAPARNALKIMAGISLALLLLISLGITWAIARITRPLAPMMDEMHRLAGGDFRDRAAGAVSDDELGRLARAMAAMRSEVADVLGHVSDSATSLAASVEQMNATTSQSAQASQQIAESITDVAGGAAEQLDAVTRTTATMASFEEEIQGITQRAHEAAGKGREASAVASDGGQ